MVRPCNMFLLSECHSREGQQHKVEEAMRVNGPAPLCLLQFMQWQIMIPAVSGGGSLTVSLIAPQLHSPFKDICSTLCMTDLRNKVYISSVFNITKAVKRVFSDVRKISRILLRYPSLRGSVQFLGPPS